MPWTTFDLSVPEGDELEFLAGVREWVRLNCTKTGKILLLSKDGSKVDDGTNFNNVALDIWHTNAFFSAMPIGLRLKFRAKRDALLFKMFYQEHISREIELRFKWARTLYALESPYFSQQFKKRLFPIILPGSGNVDADMDYHVTVTYDFYGPKRSKLTPKRKALKRAKRNG